MALPILCLGARPVDAQEPSATGLWQNIDPETNKPDGWFYIYEHNGTYEGAIARMFTKPGEPTNPLCTKCVGDQQNAPWLGLTIIKGMERKGLDYGRAAAFSIRARPGLESLDEAKSRQPGPDREGLPRRRNVRKGPNMEAPARLRLQPT